ncbi:eukaryotic membrane protein family-domain-containing protein [Stachybotrys elegans]|uniref:Eukaryotic membrane protein family-domain-containing protein n=1 Tax=Stachybotrys elegans TaxID=80388 RepID=A0A8K0SVY2_9HYPO|nr:eukaryotic membrane protein family-domain-containing protein [Stachybotrys elegans]
MEPPASRVNALSAAPLTATEAEAHVSKTHSSTHRPKPKRDPAACLHLPINPADEDRSSEDDSHHSTSPRSPKRQSSDSSSISDFTIEEDAAPSSQNDPHHDANGDTDSVKPRGRSSTIKTPTNDSVQRLSAAEMRELTSSPGSLPVAPAPPPRRPSLDQDTLSRPAALQEAFPRLGSGDGRYPRSSSRGPEPGHRDLWPPRDTFRRPTPAPRTLSTPPSSRKQPFDQPQSSPRRYSFHPMQRPLPLTLNLDGLPAFSNGAATAPVPSAGPPTISLQPADATLPAAGQSPNPPSPIPTRIPLPPMSLPTHLQLELAAQRPSPLYIHQSYTNDIPYESSAVKLERLKNVILVPLYLERTLYFGALACLDAWLYTFTVMPIRFVIAVAILVRWWAYLIGKEIRWLVGYVWDGMGRLWRRGRVESARRPSDVSEGNRSRSQSNASQAPSEVDGIPRPREILLNLRIDPRAKGYPRAMSPTKLRSGYKPGGSSRHRRTKSMPSNLSAFNKADLLQGAVIICSSLALMRLDASRMYHFIRAQSAIKLYVIYNILEVSDRLLSALGQDILECLFSSETLSRNSSGRSKVLLPLGMFVLALLYNCLHSVTLYYQVITLNVAVNSYSNALLTLLLSNQFVEIKSTVFKRIEKDNLFQLTCADIVERFHLWIMLLIIGMRNVVEVGGLSVPGAGSDSGSDDTVPLHNHSILPHSFTVLPSWLMSGEVLSPFLIVIGSEMLVDAIKHAYVTKFNNIKPAFYGRILDILCKDYYTNAFTTPSLTRRLGLAVTPLSCLFIRASIQTYHMFLSTHIAIPTPQSTQTSLAAESATPSSPAVMAALNRFDTLIRDSLGRSTHGPPYGSARNNRPWYSWTSDDVIAALTMVVFFFIAFLVLLIVKLLLGMLLLKYSRNRYAKMKAKEHLIATGKLEKEKFDVMGKRSGGHAEVEVGEERQRWIHADPTEGLKGGRGPGRKKDDNRKPETDLSSVARYEMVAKRIW